MEGQRDVKVDVIVEEVVEVLGVQPKFSLQVSAEELAEIEAERKSIIETAKANGTCLKAPNGKDTNLTPEQWVDVRTSRFKKWFGDWLKTARIEKLRNSKDAEISGNEFAITEDYKQNKKNALKYSQSFTGQYTNADTGVVIGIYRGRQNGGVNEVLQHNYKDVAHIQSIAAIPQIIENSIYIESQSNNDVEKNPDVAEYQCYVCGLKIGGEEYTVLAKVAVDKNGNRYYDHNLTAIAKGKLIDIANNEQSAVTSGFGTTPDTESTTNSHRKYKELISILQTNSSKIVDENGEPKVVHHGTQTKFDTFDIKYFGKTDFGDSGKGFYFKDNPSGYGGAQNIDMQVFLNIKNPYKVYKYSAENNLGGLYKTSIFGRTKQQLKEDIKNGLKNEEDYNEPLIDEGLSIIDTLSNEEVSFINSHDGVIALTKEGSVVEYVTPNSNQIKSATDNVGTYSAANDDIHYSLITPEMDASYLDAVERGDMEAAQRMVVEAAKLAMPNTKVVDENEFIQALRAFVSLFPKKVKRDYSVDKVVTEETFGGIWIEDTEEFAKFVSAVNKSPFEEDGEGIAYTDNYFYAYYRNVENHPVPYASVYLNKDESQDVVNQVNEEIGNVRTGERVKKYVDSAIKRFGRIQDQNNANDGNNSGISFRGEAGGLGSDILRKGRYFDNPELYSKVKRADSGSRGQGKVVYSLITPEMDATYLDAVERGDMVTAQEVTRFMLPDPGPM